MNFFKTAAHQIQIIGRAAGYVAAEIKHVTLNAIEDFDWKKAPKKTWGWIKEHPYQTAFIIFNVIVLIHPPILMPLFGALGFTTTGVAAGSMAAMIQSIMGPVAAGSLFAILQSAAMGGYGLAVVLGIGRAVAALCVLGPIIKRAIRAAMAGDSDAAAERVHLLETGRNEDPGQTDDSEQPLVRSTSGLRALQS